MIAVEGVADFSPLGGEGHLHRQRRPVDALFQGAEVIRDALGQHRHDAVGEIDRVAALKRLAVERSAGAHIGGDIGDCDGDDYAAEVLLVGVGFRVDRVVMVLGVGRIDCEERQVAKILAAGHDSGFCRLGFGKHVLREDVRDFVRVDGDHRNRLLRGQRSQHLDHPSARQAVPAGRRLLDLDQIALFRAVEIVSRDGHLRLATLDRFDSEGAVVGLPEHAEHGFRALLEYLHHAAGVGRAFSLVRGEGLCQHAVAYAGRRAAAGWAQRNDRRLAKALVPFTRPRQKPAVRVARIDLEHADMRQAARAREALAFPVEQALVLKLAQRILQPGAVVALQRKGLGYLALARAFRVLVDVFEDVFLGRPEVAFRSALGRAGGFASTTGASAGNPPRQGLRPFSSRQPFWQPASSLQRPSWRPPSCGTVSCRRRLWRLSRR